MWIFTRVANLEARTGKLEQENKQTMATVEELTAALTDLDAAIKAKLTAIEAEFTKLEGELAAGGVPATALDPIKTHVTELKAAIEGTKVPTA